MIVDLTSFIYSSNRSPLVQPVDDAVNVHCRPIFDCLFARSREASDIITGGYRPFAVCSLQSKIRWGKLGVKPISETRACSLSVQLH